MEGSEIYTRSGRHLKVVCKRRDRQRLRVAMNNRRAPLSELSCIVNQSLPYNILSRTESRRPDVR